MSMPHNPSYILPEISVTSIHTHSLEIFETIFIPRLEQLNLDDTDTTENKVALREMKQYSKIGFSSLTRKYYKPHLLLKCQSGKCYHRIP